MKQDSLLTRLAARRPLIHCISNIVTANDCANLILAVGASPIMAQAPQEMEEIVSKAGALVLNLGTPNQEKLEAARIAGRTANRLSIPVVLDPVGVGASRWRRESAAALLKEVHPDILRANPSEAAALLGLAESEHGVDAAAKDAPSPERAAALAKALGCVVLLSGEADLITDGTALLTAAGGSEKMRRLTGAGCMLSALCGAFAAAEPDFLRAAAAAARCWKRCAEKAETGCTGMGSFHARLFDAAGALREEDLE